jgi:hypothetical protein
MTDRELLELAAKAAGVDFDGNTFIKSDRYSSNIWDPLFDDGDAMRLAVQLSLSIDIGAPGFSPNDTTVQQRGCAGLRVCEPHNSDPLAATRRAIVRAAAEMAKAST